MLLEKVVDNQIIFYILVAITGLGIFAKIIAQMITGRLLREARNIHHSNHCLMKLIKAKYEHANLVAERVQNVEAFVDKYLYEYRVMGIKYYSWKSMELRAMWLVLAVGILGGALEYLQRGFGESVLRSLVLCAIGAIFLFLLHILADEGGKMSAIRTYIVDYLQNVCAHRYAKVETMPESMEVLPKTEEVEATIVEEKKADKPASEILIREILEEFLA